MSLKCIHSLSYSRILDFVKTHSLFNLTSLIFAEIFSVLAYLYTNWLAYKIFSAEKGETLVDIIEKQEIETRQEVQTKRGLPEDEVLDLSRNSSLANNLL